MHQSQLSQANSRDCQILATDIVEIRPPRAVNLDGDSISDGADFDVPLRSLTFLPGLPIRSRSPGKMISTPAFHKKSSCPVCGFFLTLEGRIVGGVGMAERGRFELPDPVKGQRFSRPPQSTTLPPLRDNLYFSMSGFFCPVKTANATIELIAPSTPELLAWPSGRLWCKRMGGGR